MALDWTSPDQGASMSEITWAAGTFKATIYHRFGRGQPEHVVREAVAMFLRTYGAA